MFPNGAEFSLSLTFDIEMTPNFPYWTSKWNHRKGAIDEDTKLYLMRMSEIAKSYGVKLQFFLVGSALEDPNIDYLKQLVEDGHAIDNHTYTHVNVKAKDIAGLQEIYAAAPWRAEGPIPVGSYSAGNPSDECRNRREAGRKAPGLSYAGRLRWGALRRAGSAGRVEG